MKISERVRDRFAIYRSGVRIPYSPSFSCSCVADQSPFANPLLLYYVRRSSAHGVKSFAIHLIPCLFGLPVLFFAKAPSVFPGAIPVCCSSVVLTDASVLCLRSQRCRAQRTRIVPEPRRDHCAATCRAGGRGCDRGADSFTDPGA